MLLPLRAANNIFSTTITAFDVVVGARVKGRSQETQEGDRLIKGTIQPADDKTVALLPDGAESDGAQLLHTSATVSAYDVTNDSEVNNQTYVRHAGEVWKLWKTQNWKIHAGLNRYILTKYRNTDVAR